MTLGGHEAEAHRLADRLPDLMVEAIRVASTVAHGLHGRRRAGPGETFWQFRQYQPTDSITAIDWRRSASSDSVFVREREWEAAHTIWLWPDISRSMAFKSHLARLEKRDRALVITLALAELLVRGGERVGLLGLTRPTASRHAVGKLAEALAVLDPKDQRAQGLPPAERISRLSGVVLVGDFLDPIEELEPRIRTLGAEGALGHIVQVLDPAEESLPYSGRTEFIGLESEQERWTAERAEGLRERYRKRLAEQKERLGAIARKLGWSYSLHHTDHSAAEPLIALVQRFSAGRHLDRSAAGGR